MVTNLIKPRDSSIPMFGLAIQRVFWQDLTATPTKPPKVYYS